jgi:hypothetical protein
MFSFRIKLFCVCLWIGSSAIMASAPVLGFAHLQRLPASRLEHWTRRTCPLRSTSTQLAAVKREDQDRTRKMLSNPEVVRVMQVSRADSFHAHSFLKVRTGGLADHKMQIVVRTRARVCARVCVRLHLRKCPPAPAYSSDLCIYPHCLSLYLCECAES